MTTVVQLGKASPPSVYALNTARTVRRQVQLGRPSVSLGIDQSQVQLGLSGFVKLVQAEGNGRMARPHCAIMVR